MKQYLPILFLFFCVSSWAQDCHGPIIVQKYPEIIATYNVYSYIPNTKDSTLILSVKFDSINKTLRKHFFESFCVGNSGYVDPCIEIFKVDAFGNAVLDTLIEKYTYGKDIVDTLIGEDINSSASCKSVYFYKADKINYIENFLYSKLEFTNYFIYDNTKKLIQTKAIKPNKNLFATVDYEYTADGYKQILKFYTMEKNKQEQENIWYIWEYIIKNRKMVGKIYSNNEEVFEKDEILYDEMDRMKQRNIFENGSGNFIYKYFY